MALESNDVRSDQDHNDTLIEWDDEIVDEYVNRVALPDVQATNT